jgi:glycine cleavage system H protein
MIFVRLFDSPKYVTRLSSRNIAVATPRSVSRYSLSKEITAMNTPTNLKYAKSDEWFDPDSGKVGITDYAQSQLSDIVFTEILVDEGETIEAGKAIASVESVKASAEIYSPAAGKVSAVNKDLPNKPEAINSDPYGGAWMIQLEAASAGDVMDASAYEKYCEERAH